jgi:hypothetical protein
VLYGGDCAGGEVRAKRGRKDETVSQAANDVDHERRASDVAAHNPERLCESPLDESDAVSHTFALGDPTAARAVEAYRVDFIEIGDGAVLPGNVANGALGATSPSML